MKKALLILGVVFILVFAYWTLSPLFIDKEVQDELDPALVARLEAQRKVDEAKLNKQAEETTAKSEAVENTESDAGAAQSVAQSFGIINRGPFPITGTRGHPATGNIEIIESPEEKLVYYKDYDGTNGPDLKVYLSKDLEASEIFDLGEAKGNQGNLIYGVPLDINISEYKYVITWCKAFGVLFDYAEIN